MWAWLNTEVGVLEPEVSQTPNIRPSAILDLFSTFLDNPHSIFDAGSSSSSSSSSNTVVGLREDV